MTHRPLLILLATLCLAGSLSAQPSWTRKKLIETGWDNLDTAALRKHLAEVEATPFDGAFIVVNGTRPDGKTVGLRPAFSADPWQAEWFQGAIDDLRACKFTRFTDNFASIGANPGNVDWFDDAGWRQVVDHWRLAARIAKQGGLKGLLFDPEPYTEGFSQFKYLAQAGRAQHTFAQYYQKARERGREVMQAVAAEYPDMVLYCYFMNSVNAPAAGQADAVAALAGSGYGLYAPFIDGWLDVIPPQLVLVDGCESAYRYNSIAEFLSAAVLIKGDCQSLVSPENRPKYRAQVQVSFGIYLDAHVNPPTSPWYIDGKGGPRVERLRQNTADALRAADEYVWMYGEQSSWWPTTHPKHKLRWDEALPGASDALRLAADPLDFARRKVAQLTAAGQLTDLVRNGAFSLDRVPGETPATQIDWKQGGAPAGWSTWQEQASHGTFSWDREVGKSSPGSARAANVAGGCFIHGITPVSAGEIYLVHARCRRQGQGTVSIRVRWQTTEGKWAAEQQDKLIYGPPQSTDWDELSGVASVPEGVGRLIILLGVASQASDQDVAWFDDVQCYRIS